MIINSLIMGEEIGLALAILVFTKNIIDIVALS